MRSQRYTALLLLLAGAFVTVGALTLYLARPTPALTPWHLGLLLGSWIIAWGGSFTLLRARRQETELLLLPPVALLTGWGLLILARLAPSFLLRQTLWLALGAVVLCGAALWTTLPRLLRRYRYTLLAGGLLLLAATLVFGVNPSGYGQRLWLGLFGFYFQPSELLKLLLVIYLAAYLSDRRRLPFALGNPRNGFKRLPIRRSTLRFWWAALLPMLAMVGLALLLLIWQQDLGAALLFYLTFLALLYLTWGRLSHVILGIFLFLPVSLAGYWLSARVALRVSIWLDPWAPEQIDRAFQILQSLFAIGAGRLAGTGLGQGYPGFIPAVHTDFVYAALVEEFGLAGAMALLLLMAWIIQRGLRLAQTLESPFEALLAGGIAAFLGIQTWVIIAGNIKQIPITGVTLPFLSYGGSSLVTSLAAIGLLLNLSAPHAPAFSLPLDPEEQRNFKITARRLGQVLLAFLALAAGGTGMWSFVYADALETYAGNPRRVVAELRVRRGAILDRYGAPLADILIDERGFVERLYPVPEAAPVVGYTTLQYGTAGIEATCDTALRGDDALSPWDAAWNTALHRDPVGHPVRLTLDATLQSTAQQLLEGYRGAIVLVDAHTGEILALASAPSYHAAGVAEAWAKLRDDPDAPLLNRATQGLAQPGSALETVIWGIALQSGATLTPSQPLSATVPLNDMSVTPLTPPTTELSWENALACSCPAPFYTLGQTLGMPTLSSGLTVWGLTDALTLEIPNVAAPWNPETADPGLEAIGQGELLVTPLQMAGVAAVLGNGGVRPPLHLLAQPTTGCAAPGLPSPQPVVRPEIAETLLQSWPRRGASAGHLGVALAGSERTLTWYLGLNSAEAPRYAIAVLLENAPNPERAADIGIQLLNLASGQP